MKTTTIVICMILTAGLVTPASAFDLGDAALAGPDLSGLASDSELSSSLFDTEPTSATVAPKSTSKAVLYSLLIPGLGQSYLGEKTAAKVFFILDAAIWASFIAFTVQGDLREESYQEYAQTFAGITTTNHSDDFYSLLTQYDTSELYENDIKDEGRFLYYPDNSNELLYQYFVDNRVADYEMWLWQSVDNRRAYQDMRSASKRADRRATYSLAAAIANRVAAAFFAYRSGVTQNRERSEQQSSFSIELGVPQTEAPSGFQPGLSLIRSF